MPHPPGGAHAFISLADDLSIWARKSAGMVPEQRFVRTADYRPERRPRIFREIPAELNEAEVALLAGLSSAPAFDPGHSPQAAKDLLHSTLDKLEAAGLYSPETKQAAKDAEAAIQPPLSQTASSSPAFTRLALLQLFALVSENRVALGGLQIRTTLDLVQQEQLDCTLKAQLNRLEKDKTDNTQTCAASRLLPALPPLDFCFRQICRPPVF